MSHLVEIPRRSDAGEQRSDADWVVDVALGALGVTVSAGLAVVRTTVDSPVVRSVARRRVPFVQARLQPVRVLADLARQGTRYRERAEQRAKLLLENWTPVIVDLVVSRLDLTGIVTRHVDIDEVVRAVDLDAVVARIDLDAIVQRIDLDAAVGGVDLNAAVEGVDIDAIAGRLDLDAVIERIDVVAIVEDVIAAIDLPAIIRDSTGSMASETVRSARMTGISVDEAISRSLERHLFRRRRPPTTTDSP